MFSFIIVAKDPEKRREYIQSFCNEKGIGKFDQIFLDSVENSFGIAEVRNIQKTIYLKPNQGKEKAIILNNAQDITPEAQNALLKILEEPPQNTYIFLSCTTDSFFLPTVFSRCTLVILSEEKVILSKDTLAKHTEMLDSISSGSVREKLVVAEKLSADKNTLGKWFEESIALIRDSMLIHPEDTTYPQLLIALQRAHQLFQTTNIAPRILLEHAFLLT